jgi:hypothetical protein
VIVVEAAPVLAPGETFRPDAYVRALEAAVDAALRDGFSGAHVFVEGAWSLSDVRGVEVWWELEEMVHELGVLQRGDTVLLCQFGQDRFEPEALERAERAHPLSVAASSTGFRPRRDARATGCERPPCFGQARPGTATCWPRRVVGAWEVTIDLAEATFFDAGAYRAVTKIARLKQVRLRNARRSCSVSCSPSGEAGLRSRSKTTRYR